MRHVRASRFVSLSGLVLSILTALWFIFIPTYIGATNDPSTGLTTRTTATLIQVNGYRALIPLMIPPVLAFAGVAAIWSSAYPSTARNIAVWIVAALLLSFNIVAVFSIGLFYLPVTVLMAVAAFLVGKQKRQYHPVP